MCFDGKKMSRIAIYDQQQGMSNVHVRAIVEDLNRNIWMSTWCWASMVMARTRSLPR